MQLSVIIDEKRGIGDVLLGKRALDGGGMYDGERPRHLSTYYNSNCE